MTRKTIDIVQTRQVKISRLHMGDYGTRVHSPLDAVEMFRIYLEGVDREHFVVMCLSTKNDVNCIEIIHIGSLNACITHPREVLKSAILSNAAAFIICHNHRQGTLHLLQKILK